MSAQRGRVFFQFTPRRLVDVWPDDGPRTAKASTRTASAMSSLRCSTAMLRFPRRYPLIFLVLLIPLALLLYANFGQLNAWATNRIVPMTPIFEQPAPPPPLPATNGSSSSTGGSGPDKILLSKHSMAQYSDWLARFLGRLSTDVYFFAPPDLADTVRAVRGAHGALELDTRFASAFAVPPLEGHEAAYAQMHQHDRERAQHSPELYAVWAAKPFLLAEALRRADPAGTTYKYAFWTDAGSFRDAPVYADWPDVARVEEIWAEGARLSGTPAEDLIFFPVQRLPDVSMALWTENLGPIDNDFSEGSFFGGHPAAALWWERYFYAYHERYLAAHVFVGKDQTLINSLLVLHAERGLTVWHGDPAAPAALYAPATPDAAARARVLGDCGDPWYYYQFFLASAQERAAMARVWDGGWYWDFWRKEWWTRARETCRLTRPLAVETVLRRAFGEAWAPPPATVPF
ncbi:hypothetical protein DFH11DRAFT_1621038 [Phellopilus nigrolimitatus]|nr:hypothetical protein DFH11DRAFT_1621038 [Phellopilus nigrolimitatus]